MHIFGDERYDQARRRQIGLQLGRWALLPGALDDSGKRGASLADKVRPTLEPLEDLPASRLLEHATPFFWLNVQRTLAAAVTEPGDLGHAVERLLVTAFDCFFPLLPEDTSVSLGEASQDLVLPVRGIRVPAQARPRELRRTDGGELCIVGEGGKVLSSNGAGDWSSPRWKLENHPGGGVLVAPGATLIEEEPAVEPLPASYDASAFAEMMEQALGLIGQVDPELAERLNRLIEWFIPIDTPNLQVHRSFTSDRLVGVEFLSEAPNPIILAEAVVHEFLHNVLNVVMETEDVFGSELPGVRYYSPWRDDPRPLHGLFHALYVFSGVARFYAGAAGVVEEPDLRELVRQKRGRLRRQLTLGIEQVPRDRLSALGLQVIQGIEKALEDQTDEAAGFDPASAVAVERHFTAWKKLNPEIDTGAGGS